MLTSIGGAGLAARQMAPVLLRLSNGSPCSPEVAQRVVLLDARVESLPAGTVLSSEDTAIRRPRYLLAGWACRYRLLPDGRRQIFALVLPGEGMGVCLRPSPMANTSTATLTAVRTADAAPLLKPEVLAGHHDLVAALHTQADLEERRALDQMVRLGRLNSIERLAHLLLEIHDRLDIIGEVEQGVFSLPVTQETLADAIGLSVVHVNRTLQELRRRGLLSVERGLVRLLNVEVLTLLAQYASQRHVVVS